MKKKNRNIRILSAFFLFIICFIGVVNLHRIMKHYINAEAATTEWKDEMQDRLEIDYASVFWGKSIFVDLNGWISKCIGQRQMNGVTKLENGYLTILDEEDDINTVRKNAEIINQFASHLEELGISFLCVITPDTINKYDNSLPKGISDCTNEKLDVFVDTLDGVDYIDLREKMYEDGIDQYEMFYRTDHHWNVHGGIYAASQILGYVEENLGMQVDSKICDESYYRLETYENWHLGSRGQRVGRFFAGVDDFEMLLPRFDTDLTRMDDMMTGDFEKVFIDKAVLQNKNHHSRYTYDFAYKYTIENSFHNNLVDNEKRILVVTDSMGRVVTPYLGLAFEDMYCTVYEEITDELLKRVQPDIVTVIFYSGNIKDETHIEEVFG